MKLDNFFTSSIEFSQKEIYLKNKYQMINIALVTSSVAFIYGIIINSINNLNGFILFEILLLFMNFAMFILLRKYKNIFNFVTVIVTIQCTLFMLYIIYTTDLKSMKFIWIFTYPIVLLYFKKRRHGLYWFILMLFLLLVAPMQDFISIKFTMFEVAYLCVVLSVLGVIVYFYQIKMNEATELILKQQDMLLDFNTKLEKKVEDKTIELLELNNLLEKKVQQKAYELIEKDKLLTVQSKQAVMGEMISMIAHQWRQPLSTITLEISNLQLKRLLGEDVDCKVVDEKLAHISDTVIYLSDTIDDFQKYFHPQKDSTEIEVVELLNKAINFILPRVKNTKIKISIQTTDKIVIKTYLNEFIHVMMILLNNAVDALLETDKTDLKIDINVKDKGDKILISVIDNADGINENDLVHIFEPYFSTKAKNGTGLGLYMSQMIIQKQFDGKITVKSSKAGTKFGVEILKQVS